MRSTNDTAQMNRTNKKVYAYRRQEKSPTTITFLLLNCFFLSLFFPLSSGAQKIKRSAYDATKKAWRVESNTLNLKTTPGTKTEITLSSTGTDYILWLKGSGIAANTVMAGDELIFLLDDDSTVTLKSPSVQDVVRTASGNAYNDQYVLTQEDLEILSRHNLRALRKYSTEGYNDVSVQKETASQLKESSAAFLNELKKASALPRTSPANSPSFPGGKSVLLGFLNRNLRASLPLEGAERKYALVQFTVSADGSVDGLQIKHSAGPLFDNELLRILKRMPNWKPATQNGKPVEKIVSQPITFLRKEGGVKIMF